MNGTVIYKNLAVYKLPKILGNFICFSGTPAKGKAKIRQLSTLDVCIALLETHLLKQAHCT